MIEDTASFVPIYMLLSVTVGFMIGMALGDETRRRKNAEGRVEDLSQRLEKASFATAPEGQIKKILYIVADIHKQVLAVSKGLQKQAK
jgi:hypothetical protein